MYDTTWLQMELFVFVILHMLAVREAFATANIFVCKYHCFSWYVRKLLLDDHLEYTEIEMILFVFIFRNHMNKYISSVCLISSYHVH